MAEEAQILDTPQIDTPQGDQNPDPVKEKIKGIVVQMYKKGATKDEIQKVVDHIKSQTPAPQPAQASLITPAPSKSYDPGFPEFNPQDEAQKAADRHNKATNEAISTIHDVINKDENIKPVAQDMLVRDRQQALQDAANNVNSGATDHPVHIPTQFGLKVQPEETDQLVQDIRQNPALQEKALIHAAKTNPAKAKDIDKALYVYHSTPRATTADKQNEIADNADKISKGELAYNPINKRLTKPEGFGDSFNTSYQKREDDMALFDLADNGSKEDVIKKLNTDLHDQGNPDKPTPVSDGTWSSIGGFAGGQGKITAEATAAQALNFLAPGSGEVASTALYAHEMGRRGFANELRKSYAAFKQQGLSDSEAYDKAEDQAKKAMLVDAATGAVMGKTTGGAAAKTLEKTAANAGKLATEGGWYQGVIKSAYNHIKQETPLAARNASLAGSGELAKNISANVNGENRDVTEGVGDAAANMAALHYTISSAVAVAGKIGGGAMEGAKTKYKQLMQGISKLPVEDIKTIASQQVADNLLTPQEAAKVVTDAEHHKELDALIPKSVKNDEVRLKLQDVVKKREATAEEKSQVSAAFAEPLKLKIEGYDNKINEIVNSPEAKIETPKPEPEHTESYAKIGNVKYKTNKEDFNTFKNTAMDMAVNMKDSKFEHRLDIPDMSQEQREGAVKDIKAGKENTPRAQKFLTAIKDMHDRGVVSVNRGRGNSSEHADIPMEQWFGDEKIHDKIKAANDISPELADEVAKSGITINNIDNFKHLFNEHGFPFTTDEFNALKQHLSESGKRNAAIEPIGESGKEKETIKTNSHAPKIEGSRTLDVGNASENGGAMGEGHPESSSTSEQTSSSQEAEQPQGIGDPEENKRVSGIAQRVQEQLGLRKYQKGEGWSKEESLAFGKAAIAQGADPMKAVSERGYGNLDLGERLAIAQAHDNALNKEVVEAEDRHGIDSPEYNTAVKNLDEFANAYQPLKTESHKAFVAQQGSINIDNGNFTSVKKAIEEKSGKPLNEPQVAQVKELTIKNKALKTSADEAEAKLVKQLDEEHATPKEKPAKTKGVKKTSGDYAKERKASFDAAREALKKLRSGQSGLGVGVPFARELAAIAPHVGSIVKSLLEEGYHKLGDIVDKLHEEFSGDIPGLRRRDILDVIAGEHTKKIDTNTEESGKISEIKKQSKLLKKLQDLQSDLPEGYDKEKAEQSPEVKKLLEQIKKVKKDLADAKYAIEPLDYDVKHPDTVATEKRIKSIERQIRDLKAGVEQNKPLDRVKSEKEVALSEELSKLRKSIADAEKAKLPLKYNAESPEKKAADSRIKSLERQLNDLNNGVEQNKANPRAKTEKEENLSAEISRIKKSIKDAEDAKEPLKYTVENADAKASKKRIENLQQKLNDLKNGVEQNNKKDERIKSDKEIELEKQIKVETDNLKEVADKQKKQDNYDNLAAEFVNKKDNKFTPEQAAGIYKYMKDKYLSKDVKYRDAIAKTAEDLGLSFAQVSNAIVTPKAKPVSDEMWKRQYDLQKNRLATERYINKQGETPAIKGFKKFVNAFREVSVFGHGGIFVGTHAGMTLMDLPRAKHTVKAFFKAYRLAYGKDAYYEKAMTELKNEKNYTIAQRAGLKNNPDVINNDAEIIQPYFGKIGESGKKGFNAIKILRQALFDSHYNALSETEKADPGSAVAIAKLVNNATGASNLNIPDWVNQVTFAGGMEAARWGKLTRNPIAATRTAINAMFRPEHASVEDRVFANVWAKRVGTQLVSYASLLTLNAAIQNSLEDDPKKKVNLFHPLDSDWMKMKIGNTTFDFTSGMMSTLNFIKSILHQGITGDPVHKGDKLKDSLAETAYQYGTGKLSPFYGDVIETTTRHDYNGNTLPWSDAKPLHKFNHKMTWPEYIASKSPLPVAEGFKTFYEEANKQGMPKDKLDEILTSLQMAIISGGTGFKAYETNDAPKSTGKARKGGAEPRERQPKGD